jgi:hypothetical protein
MASRIAYGLAILLAAAACDKTTPAPNEASLACTSDNCIVPLADIEGVCATTLERATASCPGVTVSSGPCGALTHLALQTVGPAHDCYYDAASGALAGGIVRSDAGFTKIAGTVPPDACPATSPACDHESP